MYCLKPKVLERFLAQANTDGVVGTFIQSRTGGLLASAVVSGTNEKEIRASAAIASSVWNVYEKSGAVAFNEEKLRYILIECERGRVAIFDVAKLLLSVYAESKVPLGMLKLKAELLVKYLDEPLNLVSVS